MILAAFLVATLAQAADATSPVVPAPPPRDAMNIAPLTRPGETAKAEAGKLVPLTLDAAIERALSAATPVLKSQNDVKLSGETLLQSYAQFLPNLDVAGTYGYQRGTIYNTTAAPTLITTRNTAATYQLSSTLNLFSGFSDFATWKAALYRKDSSDFSLARARQQVTLDITQSYLQVILDEDVVGIAEKNLMLSQQRQVLLEEQTKVGVKNRADLFRQQAQTSSDETFLLNSQIKARNDLLALVRRLRLDEKQDYSLQRPVSAAGEKANPEYADEARLVQTALDHRSDLAALSTLSQSNDWSVTRARSAFFPHLDLGFAYVGGAHNLLFQNVAGANVVPAAQDPLWTQLHNDTYWTLGLTLSWGIFDRLVTRLDTQRAAVSADNSHLDEDDRRLQVVADARQAFGEYRAALSLMESSRKGLEAAQKAYEVESGRYEVGSATFIDLIAAQSALIQAEAARAQAMINFQLQGDQVEFAVGTL